MVLDILGTKYSVIETNEVSQPRLSGKYGFADPSSKEIWLDESLNVNSLPDSRADMEAVRKKVIRHEIIHAMLFESGLDAECWAAEEEIVDWIALQYPKLKKIFSEADCE